MTANTSASLETTPPLSEEERLRRWRLVLGGEAEGSCGKLSGQLAEMDQVLAALYDADGKNGLVNPPSAGADAAVPRPA